MDLQSDSEHFERFDNFVGKFDDWYSDLSGGGVFGDLKHFGFYFVAVEWFDGEYFEDRVAFGDGCFEEQVEFGRMRKHIWDFG